METVEAIQDIHQINLMKQYLKEHSKRDYLLFVIGINTGLKISELLEMKMAELIDENGMVRDYYYIPENEDCLEKEVFLNKRVKEAVFYYVNENLNKTHTYLFQSAKSNKPITRQQAYRIIHNAAEAVGISGKIGTNSMRKTFGYHAYKQGVAITLLQKHFHHATPSETMKYIGISKNEVIRTAIDVNL